MRSIVRKLPDEPIIVVSLRPHDNVEREVIEVAAAVNDLRDGQPGPFYRINDFSRFSMSFREIAIGLADETRRLPGSLSDPHIKPIFAGTRDMMLLGTRAGKHERYGGLEIMLFPRLEDALGYVRAQVGARA
jgi:hypothetical protein